MPWDPDQYLRFEDERGRPFDELLSRVHVARAHRVVDLGCGPGTRTATLLDRWPDSEVVGVDNSVEMIETAKHLERDRLRFQLADLREWAPAEPVDVIVANAVLQWLPEHMALLPRLAGFLAPGGSLALQVPGNFGAPSHTILRELCTAPRWRPLLGSVAERTARSFEPADYLHALLHADLRADVWETTYLQLLAGRDPVLEWVKGTALRPVLNTLDEAEREGFLAEYRDRLAAAYPATEHGTLFPFRRIFAVGSRPAD